MELVHDGLIPAIDGLADESAARLRESRVFEMTEFARMCKSPIEQLLAVHLAMMQVHLYDRNDGDPPSIIYDYMRWEYGIGESAQRHWKKWEPFCYIEPQSKTGPYLLDFGIAFCGHHCLAPTLLAIECDGHEFHEKTKEQAAHDKQRDRYLTSHGWHIMRFSGSEIHHRAAECAAEVAAFINKTTQASVVATFDWMDK